MRAGRDGPFDVLAILMGMGLGGAAAFLVSCFLTVVAWIVIPGGPWMLAAIVIPTATGAIVGAICLYRLEGLS